jgi:hypothetical protein
MATIYDQLIQKDIGDKEPKLTNRWLPLPKLIAFCMPWRIHSEDLGAPLELSELASHETVGKLEKSLLLAYQDAIRAALRHTLANSLLPERVLESPVADSAVNEVKADLRRKGYSKGRGNESLTIGDALPFIGRRANRLLQCIDAGTDVLPLQFEDADWIHLHIDPKSSRIGLIAARRLAAREAESLIRDSNAPWSTMRPPRKWAAKRESAPESVHIVLDDGAILTARDARFGWALIRINGLMPLAGQSIPIVQASVEARDDKKLLSDWDWLVEAIHHAQRITVAEEATAFIDALLPRDDADGLSSSLLGPRYGLGGTDKTLQECGDAIGITRERIRQLQSIFEARVSQGGVYAPRIRSFLSLLNTISIETMPSLNARFKEILGNQSVTGALAFATVLKLSFTGRVVEFSISFPYALEARCWSARLSEASISAIVRSARAMTSRIGAFHLTAVLGDVTEELGEHVTRQEVKTVLSGCTQCVWLDDEIEWGTILGATDIPILEEVRKMLAVSFPVSLDITDIFAGLVQCRRQSTNRSPAAARFGGGMPPPWVVRKLLDLQEDMEVAQYDNFRLKKFIDPLTMMEGEADKRIYETLKNFGGVASWRQMKESMVDTLKLNPVTFAVMLKSCSYIYQPAYGIYAFRGQRMFIQAVWKDGKSLAFPLPPSMVSGARAVTEISDTVIEFEVSQTTSGPGRSRAVYVPSRVASRTAGGFHSEFAPGLRIRIGPTGQIGRFANELDAAGVKPKERVVLTLDLVSRAYRWKPLMKSGK